MLCASAKLLCLVSRRQQGCHAAVSAALRARHASAFSVMAVCEKVSFGDAVPGYVWGQPGQPGVVVIQEWWGVNEQVRLPERELLTVTTGGADFCSPQRTLQVKRHAAKVAAAGYRVLVPDLYKGAIGGAYLASAGPVMPRELLPPRNLPRLSPSSLLTGCSTVNKEEASHHMGALDWALAVKEIAQAAAFLKAEGSPKVGATGFCMGGALTLLGAATCPDIVCAAPFYGIPQDERVELSKLNKPILVRCCALHCATRVFPHLIHALRAGAGAFR